MGRGEWVPRRPAKPDDDAGGRDNPVGRIWAEVQLSAADGDFERDRNHGREFQKRPEAGGRKLD